MNAKATGTNHRCRYCGARLRFNLVLALLSPSQALLPFLDHARQCASFPPERRRKWQEHARPLRVKEERWGSA
jgi:hypothetical protein